MYVPCSVIKEIIATRVYQTNQFCWAVKHTRHLLGSHYATTSLVFENHKALLCKREYGRDKFLTMKFQHKTELKWVDLAKNICSFRCVIWSIH